MVDRGRIEAYGKLDCFEEKILLDRRFVRIHKSNIVNGDYISRFSTEEVELLNGNIYSVSRTMRNKAKLQYDRYIRNRDGMML